MTSCAFKIHRASGPGRGKPVLIALLACSVGFHAITFERRKILNETSVEMNRCFVVSLRVWNAKCDKKIFIL